MIPVNFVTTGLNNILYLREFSTEGLKIIMSSCLRVIVRVQPVHAMNAEQRQIAADRLEP